MLHVSGPIPPAIYCTSLTCCVPVHGWFPPSLGDCCDSGSRNKHTCACARVCGRERKYAGHSSRQSQLLVRLLFFFSRQASAPLAALQDSVFSAVRFQRKAAKQNGTGLSQILSCRWTDRRKHAGTASLWCLYTCSIYRRAGNGQRGGRNRQQVQSLTKAAFKPIILNESCSF